MSTSKSRAGRDHLEGCSTTIAQSDKFIFNVNYGCADDERVVEWILLSWKRGGIAETTKYYEVMPYPGENGLLDWAYHTYILSSKKRVLGGGETKTTLDPPVPPSLVDCKLQVGLEAPLELALIA